VSVTAQAPSSVLESNADLLGRLAAAINTNSTINPAGSGANIKASVEASALTLVLDAVAFNTSFTVDGSSVKKSFLAEPIADSVDNNGETPSVSAGSVVKQQSVVKFADTQAATSGSRYAVVVNGHEYSARIGDNASIFVTGMGTDPITVDALQSTTDFGSATSSVNGSNTEINLSSITVNATGRYFLTVNSTTVFVDGSSTITNGTQLADALKTALGSSTGYTIALASGKLTFSGTGTGNVAAASATVSFATEKRVAGLDGVRVTETTDGGRRLDLSGLAAINGGKYSVKIGNATPITITSAGTSLATIATDLAAALVADVATSYSASAVSATASNWVTLAGAIGALTEAGEPVLVHSARPVVFEGLKLEVGDSYTLAVGTNNLTHSVLTTSVSSGGTTTTSIADTPESIAQSFADKVNALGGVDSARAEGSTLWILTGAESAALTLKRTAGGTDTSLSAATILSTNIIAPIVGATYAVYVNGGGAAAATYVATSTDNAASIATALASSLGSYGARASVGSIWFTTGVTAASLKYSYVDATSGANITNATVASARFHTVIESTEMAARRMLFDAEVANVAFTVNGATVSALSAITSSGQTPTTLAASEVSQVSTVDFAGTVSSTARYTVVVDGKPYTVRAGDNHYLSISGASNQRISIDVEDANGEPVVTDSVLTWLSNIRTTASGTNLPRTLDLSGMPTLAVDSVVKLTVGNQELRMIITSATLAESDVTEAIVVNFKSQINATTGTSGLSATSAKVVVSLAGDDTADWTSLLSGLESLIEQDPTSGSPKLAATYNAADQKLILTATAANTPFSLDGAYVDSAVLSGDPAVPAVLSGTNAAQVSVVEFADLDTDSVLAGKQLDSGHSFFLTLGDQRYAATIGQSGVTGDWASILNSLAGQINTDYNAHVQTLINAATVAQPYAGTKITAAVDAANRRLTLTAQSQNMSFLVGEVGVELSGARSVTGGVINAGTTPTVAASTAAAQVTDLQFPSTINSATTYSVTVNATTYSVKPGDTVNSTLVQATTASVLEALKFKINADGSGAVTATRLCFPRERLGRWCRDDPYHSGRFRAHHADSPGRRLLHGCQRSRGPAGHGKPQHRQPARQPGRKHQPDCCAISGSCIRS
jgi:hypothetical protein